MIDDRKRAELTIAVERAVRELVTEARGDESDVMCIFGVALAAVMGPMMSSAADRRALLNRVVDEMLDVYEKNLKAA